MGLFGYCSISRDSGGRAPPPSLPPSLLLLEPELHSSPLRSIHTQGAAGERADPLCDQCGNVHKFWNLKPWRGYLPQGSLEPVSTAKTLEQGSFRVEGAVFGGNIALTFPPFCIDTVWWVWGCVSSLFPNVFPARAVWFLHEFAGEKGGGLWLRPKAAVESRADGGPVERYLLI